MPARECYAYSSWRKILRDCEWTNWKSDYWCRWERRLSKIFRLCWRMCTAICVMYVSCPLMRLHLGGPPRWQYIRCAKRPNSIQVTSVSMGGRHAKACFSSVSITASSAYYGVLARVFWCANPVTGRAFRVRSLRLVWRHVVLLMEDLCRSYVRLWNCRCVVIGSGQSSLL